MEKLKTEWQEMVKLARIPEIKAFWVITGLQSLGSGWFFGTYILFLLSHGMSLFQANIINAIFMATDTLFNPYTGKLADKYGQKKVFLSGQIFWFLGMLTYGFSRTFWGFAGSEAISAVGSALMSDALESWLRNRLPEETVHKALAHSGVFQALGIIPAATIGALVGAKYGLQWPWFIAAATGVPVVAATLKLLWKLPEVYEADGAEVTSVWQVAKLNWSFKPLRTVALVTMIIAICTQPFNMFWAPILQSVSGQSWWLGSLWIGIAIASSIGSFWARKQNSEIGVVKMILFIGIPMLLTPIVGSIAPLTGLFLFHEIGRGATRPILFTYANKHMANKSRSTANSLLSSMRTLGAAIGLLVFGALTTFMRPVQTWGVSALMLIVLAGWMWRRRSE